MSYPAPGVSQHDDPWDHIADPIATGGVAADDAVATLWQERHQALGAWRSGGDRGLSAQENFEFYVVRQGRLVELIRRHAGRERGLHILDAGCGQGHITDSLRKCGHRAVGIDGSPAAIARARETYGPHFARRGLDAYRAPVAFDVVVCIDVLFHVLDDATWRAAIDAFGRYAGAEALIIVTDVFGEERYAPHAHIVHRTAAAYDEAFAAHDFGLVERLPYDFGGNPIQFAVFRRGP